MKKIIHLLSIVVMFALIGCGNAVITKETPEDASAMKVISPAPPLSSKNQPEISMNEFNQIKNGMTYEQVTEIIGSPGEMVLETGTPGDQFYTAKYHFKGDGGLWGAQAELTFQNGKLSTKTQTGLKRVDSPGM